MNNKLYWAFVKFVDQPGGKTRPVLLLRRTQTNYIIFRLTSKFKNKSHFFQSKYIPVKDWKESNLPKPSWVDTYQTYTLPIKKTSLTFIGCLSNRDYNYLAQHVKL